MAKICSFLIKFVLVNLPPVLSYMKHVTNMESALWCIFSPDMVLAVDWV